MEPSPSRDPHLGAEDVARLLDSADAAILEGLAGHSPEIIPLQELPDAFRRTLGSFVTLHVDDELNGCIGNVEGIEPLGHAVPRLAWSAAFADPRLPGLQPSERDRLTIEISLLSPLSALAADSYAALVANVQPGTDGVVVRAGRRQGLFLPSVWAQLSDAEAFVGQLFRKAGLVAGSWSTITQVYRFTTTTYRRGPGPERTDQATLRSSR